MRTLAALIAIGLTLPVGAEDVHMPRPRPVELAAPATPVTAPIPADKPAGLEGRPEVPLPRPRPDPAAEKPAVPDDAGGSATPPAGTDHIAPQVAPSEPPKPPRVYQSACPAVIMGQVEAKALPPIAEDECGTQSPLSLTGVLVNGRMVPVAGGVTTTCGMATALPGWVAEIDGYLFARENTHVAEVVVGTSYMCRNVNNAQAGDLSFHAFADAMDVVGFRLEDGRMVTVESGWADALSPEGRLLRFAHDSACARFTTTLGPEANALHHDHLHVDLGCHGKTCTARLCE